MYKCELPRRFYLVINMLFQVSNETQFFFSQQCTALCANQYYEYVCIFIKLCNEAKHFLAQLEQIELSNYK